MDQNQQTHAAATTAIVDTVNYLGRNGVDRRVLVNVITNVLVGLLRQAFSNNADQVEAYLTRVRDATVSDMRGEHSTPTQQ